MAAKRQVLEALTRGELQAVAEQFELEVEDRRVKDQLVDAAAASRNVDLGEVLAAYPRDRLKALCRELGLDDSGKEKAPIVHRLLGHAGGAQPRQDDQATVLNTSVNQVIARRPPSAGAPEPKRGRAAAKAASGADLGFEAKLFQAADKLRSNMDASAYKHVVLGLIFLKYISDAFEELHARLLTEAGADPEDRDEYRAERVFWVPKVARWSAIQAQAKSPSIGQLLDSAMAAIEHDNPALRATLPKDYGRPGLDKQRLGELVDLIGTIGMGSREHQSKDVLGRVYEYFLSEFALAEGKKGGQFYTPRSVVRVLVEMLAPYKGRIYDPACGSGGMFVSSEKFIEEHGGKAGDISVYGQESNETTWKLAKMNLAIRGIEANLGAEHADTFHRDQHPDLRADYVLANPPFNDSDWGGERLVDDVRWKYGVPPTGNANFAWVQHFIHHLAPGGLAGFVLANGSMSSNQSGEGEIRRAIVEADLVDCMIALPGQLFYSTGIPVCLWFVTRDKRARGFRDRRGELLFIDARKLGRMIDRTQRELTDDDIAKIAGAYHAWRGDKGAAAYADVAGFCKSATLDEVRAHQHVLTPGRYVGAEEVEEDGEGFEATFPKLVAKLEEQFAAAECLARETRERLGRVENGP
jgi:type I restriction enzyme M protein